MLMSLEHRTYTYNAYHHLQVQLDASWGRPGCPTDSAVAAAGSHRACAWGTLS